MPITPGSDLSSWLLHCRPLPALRRKMRDAAFMARLLVGFNLLNFGVLVWRDGAFSTSQTYAWFVLHGGEHVWGPIYTVSGLLTLAGAVSRKALLRSLTTLYASVFSGIITVSYFTSNPSAPGWSTYFLLTLVSYWTLWLEVCRDPS